MRAGILARPITGHWFGAKWSNDPKWVWEYKYDVTYIHSSWLFYLYKMGLVGTVLMIFYLGARFYDGSGAGEKRWEPFVQGGRPGHSGHHTDVRLHGHFSTDAVAVFYESYPRI